MSLKGVIPAFDWIIFADTGWEPSEVCRHLEWCQGQAAAVGQKIHIVSNGNILEHALRSRIAGELKPGETWAVIPYYLKKGDGSVDGMVRRQCTKEFKVVPIEKFCRREILGLRPGQRAPSKSVIGKFQGITLDESARMKAPREPWQSFVYPFVQTATRHERNSDIRYTDWKELGRYYTREECERWLQDNYPGIRVPRSACLGCPFHTDAEWREIKSRPEEWETVLTLDRHLRTIASKKAAPYLHRSRKPLDELSFSR
jgi:hypothetical protein